MKYVIQKDVIKKQIISLYKSGGHYQLAATKIKGILGDVAIGNENPLKGIPLTNHGESRINHCIKYDLNGFCRLITIQDNGICALVFAGKHEECDKWLNANKGYTLTLKDNNELIGLKITEDISKAEPESNLNTEISDGRLVEKIKGRYLEIIQNTVSAFIYKQIESFDAFTTEEEILQVCEQIKQEGDQEMILDVLIYALADDIDAAKNRILIFEEKLTLLNQANKKEVDSIVSGEQFIVLDDFMDRDLHKLITGSSWLDWMLFMHPQQKAVVDKDFNGPARLLGVSGSGKTCVTVNRAIRLAKKYPGEKVLITTINPALAKLIGKLIEQATDSDTKKEELKDQIEVKSFWELSRQMLLEFEADDLLRRGYNQYADKNLEDVDEVWKEYYLCENNNRDAQVMLPIHQSLISRNILPLEYVKQEFDWIRSALAFNERSEYLTIERIGRSEPIHKEFRGMLLEGLKGWESKMKTVGVCDYLGLIGPLHSHIEKINPRYRCILVDELQDFGTTELSIIRLLVDKQENDIFLCGDIAQQVQTKHQMITKAGITILPTNFLNIKKNYRNSREILEAASQVFKMNVDENQYNQGGFELLNPEFANFSSPKPFIRIAASLEMEIKYALTYLKSILTENEKACVAICGLTYFQVKYLGEKLGFPVLDGEMDIEISNIFISDLDQTKGFEFDRMIILNCSNGVFPNPKLPEKEWFREISKLYVSMTRAKRELIISATAEISNIFSISEDLFNLETSWTDYVDKIGEIEFPNINSEIRVDDFNAKEMKGMDFLYSRLATGISHAAQEKIYELIQGKKSTATSGNTDGWLDMATFISDLNNPRFVPHMSRLLGPSVYKELKEKFGVH